MKIDKLYTLSQFVEYLANRQMHPKDKWILTFKYNEFLKHRLTKEMFVNELEKPEISFKSDLAIKEARILYQESENKVIFENIIIRNDFILLQRYGANVKRIYFNEIEKGKYNLAFIAEKTGGSLKLKNVEL